MKQKEQENKVFIAMNKAFVKVHLPSKNGERTYNRAILPNGTTIDGTDRGGFVFYPLYVNEAASNPNLYRMPFLKDRMVQLHRGDQMVEVTPEALRDALNARHQQYLRERTQQQDGRESVKKEEPTFDWENKSFSEYVREFTIEKLETLESGSEIMCFNDELTEKLIEYDRALGSISSNPEESMQFIARHFMEAKKTHDWLKEREELPVPDINPFDDPEQFHLAMVEKGMEELLQESEFMQSHGEERMCLDKATLKRLKQDLEPKGKGRSFEKRKETEQEMELP